MDVKYYWLVSYRNSKNKTMGKLLLALIYGKPYLPNETVKIEKFSVSTSGCCRG